MDAFQYLFYENVSEESRRNFQQGAPGMPRERHSCLRCENPSKVRLYVFCGYDEHF